MNKHIWSATLTASLWKPSGQLKIALQPDSLQTTSATNRHSLLNGILKLRQRRSTPKIALAFLFVLALPILALAQVPNYGDVSIKVVAQNASHVGDGYGEFLTIITNYSTTQAHKITVQIPFYGYEQTVNVKEIRRTIELAPQSTAKMLLFCPSQASADSYANVIIDGIRQDVLLEIERYGLSFSTGSKGSLLVSHPFYESGWLNATNIDQSWKDSSHEFLISTQSFNAPLSEWSTNWLSYARFGGVMLFAEELNSAPEVVRSTLQRYVERGGTLIVAGNWQPPVQWQAWRSGIKDEDIKDDESSSIDVPTPTATPAPPTTSASHKPQADLQSYHLGFGLVITTGSLNPNEVTVNQWKQILLELNNRSLRNKDFYSLIDLNKAFQVVEQFGVPIRGLFLLMLVFVLVIGPVNLIWLAKRKRKIWMLWTVPAISLLTCLFVVGFSLYGEGWSATAKTEVLTILDETAHRATTIGWTGFYSPITPSDGLHFSYDSELAPQFPSEMTSYRYRPQVERTVDWTNDQHLESGWIAARIPAFFKLRKSEVRRERLNIRQAGSEAMLVNGLGAEIAQVWWADASGKIYSATNIAAGASAKLTATELKASATASRLREAYSGDWLKEFKAFSDKPQEVLMPNSYLAVLNGAPFVEEGLKDVKLRTARNLVYGVGGEVSDQYRAR